MNNPNPFSTPEGIKEVLLRDGYHAAARLIEQLQSSISKDAEWKYLMQFVFEGNFYADVCREQLRSLWTAYCFHHNLDVDTAEYDYDLRTLWNAIIVPERESPEWSSFEGFECFMCKELV